MEEGAGEDYEEEAEREDLGGLLVAWEWGLGR